MKKIKRDIVVGMLFSKDNKLLMAFRGAGTGGVYPDTWHIPGGGIESGETHVQALKRELSEELDFDLASYPVELFDDKGADTTARINRYSGTKETVEMKFYVYKVLIHDKKHKEIKITLNEELSDYKWFDLNEISQVPLSGPSEKMFKRLGYL